MRTLAVLILMAIVATPRAGRGQDVRVKAGFTTDSLRVGDEVFFYLVAEYPREYQVLFPESTFNYSPFELRTKRYFPTRTEAGVSYDSAVYYLTTFEVEPAQALTAAVYQILNADSVRYAAAPDTIWLRQQVRKLPDSINTDLPLRPTMAYQRVPRTWNVPLLAMGATVMCLALALGYAVLGKPVRRYYRLKRLERMHAAFLDAYTRQADDAVRAVAPPKVEATVLTWKKYLEELTGVPYTRMTTAETARVEQNKPLIASLKRTDASIYGSATDIREPLAHLKDFAEDKYAQIVNVLKDEK